MATVVEDARTHKLGRNSDAKWLLAQIQWYCWRKARSPRILLEAVQGLCREHQLPLTTIGALLGARDAAGLPLFLAPDKDGYVVLVDYWWERSTSTARVNAMRIRRRDQEAAAEPGTGAAVAEAGLLALANNAIATVSNGFNSGATPALAPLQVEMEVVTPLIDPIALSAQPPAVPTVLRKGAPVPEAWVQAVYDTWEGVRREAFADRVGPSRVRRRYLDKGRRDPIVAAFRRGNSLEATLAAVQGWVHDLVRADGRFDRLQYCELKTLLTDLNITRFSEWHWGLLRPGETVTGAAATRRLRQADLPAEEDAWERAAVRVGGGE